jgi:hypothetical protein
MMEDVEEEAVKLRRLAADAAEADANQDCVSTQRLVKKTRRRRCRPKKDR